MFRRIRISVANPLRETASSMEESFKPLAATQLQPFAAPVPMAGLL
jgi:hypothetical protein